MKTQQLEDVDLARSAVSSTGEIVAAKWTPLLIHELGGGTRRFRELERVCEGMSTRTLADRLRTLEQAGVVARHSYPESPPRVEYQLTEKGRALLPIIREMRKFGTNWLVPGAARGAARSSTASRLSRGRRRGRPGSRRRPPRSGGRGTASRRCAASCRCR